MFELSISITLSVVLAGISVWLITYPHLSRGKLAAGEDSFSGSASEHSKFELEEKKHRYIQLLKDLELDLHTNKLDQAEYERLKAPLVGDLAKVLQQLS